MPIAIMSSSWRPCPWSFGSSTPSLQSFAPQPKMPEWSCKVAWLISPLIKETDNIQDMKVLLSSPLPNCGTRQNTTIWTVHSPPVPWQPGPLVLSRSEVRNLQLKQVQYLWECPYCSHDVVNATQTCENLISLKLPISINENVVKATNICLHANTECSIKLLWLWKGREWF